MDAIVTIQVLDGKKVIGTLEKAVEIHPTIGNEIKDIPGIAGAWILGEARARFTDEGAEWSTPKTTVKKAD